MSSPEFDNTPESHCSFGRKPKTLLKALEFIANTKYSPELIDPPLNVCEIPCVKE